MELTDILSPASVKVLGNVSSKKRLFQTLGEAVRDTHGITCTDVTAALQERENLGPTGVGNGIALPHARLEGLDRVIGLFVRLETPMDFGSVDRTPVDLIFTLLAPQSAGMDHLKALALVSRTLRDASLCTALRANTDPTVLHTLLTEGRASQAA